MRIGRRERKEKLLPAIVLFSLFIAGIGAFRLFIFWITPAGKTDNDIVVQIPPGSSFVKAAQLLNDAEVIRSVRLFVLMGKIRGLSGSIQAGELSFRVDMTPKEVLDVLSRGKAFLYSITVPEGYTVKQIGKLLQEKELADYDRIIALSEDTEFVRSLDVPADRLEGFLFPDTYAWPRGTPEEQILRRMVEHYKKIFTPDLRIRANAMGMTELDVVILASIVERETGSPDERGLVSAVFHNRLRKKYRLQSDPTVIYGLDDFDGDLKKSHLRKDTPYNTYTRLGLPIGPIANPGAESIRAALYPEKVPYLYFVSRGDGTHVFSNTLVEHNKAV
ncbi:MAG: endolytic transglycosylase MltG, partial [bacterium]